MTASSPPPTVLVAPAAFKGTLSAPEAAQAIALGLMGFNVQKVLCPVADGGNDTLAVLTAAVPGYQRVEAVVCGPLPNTSQRAAYLVHPQRREVIIEAAAAHGINHTPALVPLEATSYGVGQLITHALQNIPPLHPWTMIVTLGGSASSDGGAGMLQALGVQLLDKTGQPFSPGIGGGALTQIAAIQSSPHQWPRNLTLTIATDVENPLLGPLGAARVFGPQKGATPQQVEVLEASLQHWSTLCSKQFNINHTQTPGAGAAGGLGYGLLHLPNSNTLSGAQWLFEAIQLWERVQQADWIVTGEGRLDETTLQGKATGQLLRHCGQKPVVFLCGQQQPGLCLPQTVTVLCTHTGCGLPTPQQASYQLTQAVYQWAQSQF